MIYDGIRTFLILDFNLKNNDFKKENMVIHARLSVENHPPN
jgi:hypothetical protein